MISVTIFPGRYIQSYDAIKLLGGEIARFGKNALVIYDRFIVDTVLPRFTSELENEIKIKQEQFGGEVTEDEIARLSSITAEMVVGIGGGKTLDTAKAVAYEMGVPVAIVPTAASTDAPCSALSVIYTPEGTVKRLLMLPKNPDLVLVDTRIIAEAPVRLLVSGMGDALATWFEAESVKLNYGYNMTGNHGSMTAYALARLCYDTLLEHGLAAKTACEINAVTPALTHIAEANTLLSGLGFESGGLGAAHAIHNGLTVLEQTHMYYHGEKVAFGTLASLWLTDKPMEIIDEVYCFCESIGLPTTFADIGLADISDEELMKVAVRACEEGESIYNEPIPVVPWMVVDALKMADAEGRERKQNRISL